ncbi:inactive protein restricted tev movement 1 [Phtheirospermum japonicum]|uniref:Inactive protein restricted tev movement 1 n=1 Tax=Phtheirospermum japonicum TaxID=374723 RepID=A0A830BIL1_9LAMI|nr:inactive protein restricted tev movement 1 [Phtheirospermum japonicum]
MGDDSSLIKIGPVGNKNGDSWDEKGHNKIVQIFICHDDEINSIQFQYVENGNMALSDRHGNNDGYKFDVAKLNYPTEYITWISGHKSYHNNNICSITFGTNRGEYGPFGQSTNYDKEFKFQVGEDRQFGGFHGTTDQKNVKSIGVYLKPNTTLDYSVNKNIVKPSTKEGDQSWEILNELQVQENSLA